jgi:hypothetical protein
LTFNKYEQKRSPSEQRDGNCHVFANSHWEILAPLLLTGGGYLGISQRLSYTNKEFPGDWPVAFGHFPAAFPPLPFYQCPVALKQPLRKFPSSYQLKRDNIPFL